MFLKWLFKSFLVVKDYSQKMLKKSVANRVWFVSRHPGAVEWAKLSNLPVDRWVEQIDTNDLTAGDVVIGSLPMHLAAQVCERGCDFYALTFNVTREERGVELNGQHLFAKNCQIRKYKVQEQK